MIDFHPPPPNECTSWLASTSRAAAPWSTARRSKPKSGADDQLHCVGESRITSHNIAAFRRPTDSMKDSKQGELIEEESRWVESQILPRYITILILKTMRYDSKCPRLKKRHHRIGKSESAGTWVVSGSPRCHPECR